MEKITTQSNPIDRRLTNLVRWTHRRNCMITGRVAVSLRQRSLQLNSAAKSRVQLSWVGRRDHDFPGRELASFVRGQHAAASQRGATKLTGPAMLRPVLFPTSRLIVRKLIFLYIDPLINRLAHHRRTHAWRYGNRYTDRGRENKCTQRARDGHITVCCISQRSRRSNAADKTAVEFHCKTLMVHSDTWAMETPSVSPGL